MNAKTAMVMRALGVAPAGASESDPTPPESAPAVPSFDGGVRGPALHPPESHGEWLLRIIRRESDVPSDWPWPRA